MPAWCRLTYLINGVGIAMFRIQLFPGTNELQFFGTLKGSITKEKPKWGSSRIWGKSGLRSSARACHTKAVGLPLYLPEGVLGREVDAEFRFDTGTSSPHVPAGRCPAAGRGQLKSAA